MAGQPEITLIDRFRPVRTFIFDVDGVLTDGTFTGNERGNLLRAMNIKDCYAMQQAVQQGYKVYILSASDTDAVKLQLAHFEVKEVHLCLKDKAAFLHKLAPYAEFSLDTALYMGDDVPDGAAMNLCGLRSCPSDAAPEIQQLAHYISPFGGGKGCVRDVIEKVLKLNGHWPAV